MNKRTKLIVSLLFVVVIILAAAVTRFYSSVPAEVIGGVNQPDVARRLESNANGYDIFENSSGLCGILDNRDRMIVVPEWLDLSFAEGETCIASKRIGGKTLRGCIDFEGNVTVPFIYGSITPHQNNGVVFYIAEADADGQFVIYDSSFRPVFRQSWSGAKYSDGKLILVDQGGIFTYSFGKNGMNFMSAKVSGETLDCPYTMEVSSSIILDQLTSQMLEEIVSDTGAYLEYAFTGDKELLTQLTAGSQTGFRQLYPDDHTILEKKLRGVSEINISKARLEDGSTGYAVSVKTDAGITYSDENDGKIKKLDSTANARVIFTGTGLNDLTAVSGSFREERPDYPVPEPPPPAPEFDPETGEPIEPQPTSPEEMQQEDIPQAGGQTGDDVYYAPEAGIMQDE